MNDWSCVINPDLNSQHLDSSLQDSGDYPEESNMVSDTESNNNLGDTIFENEKDLDSSKNFRIHLATAFKKTFMSREQSKAVLQVLRSHKCFSNLPVNPKRLLDTNYESAVFNTGAVEVDEANSSFMQLPANTQPICAISNLQTLSEPANELSLNERNSEDSNSISLHNVKDISSLKQNQLNECVSLSNVNSTKKQIIVPQQYFSNKLIPVTINGVESMAKISKGLPIKIIDSPQAECVETTSKATYEHSSAEIISNSHAESLLNSINAIFSRLDSMEKKINESNSLLSQIVKRKKAVVKSAPQCLPFKNIPELLQFNTADSDTYNEVVNYFIYIGGSKPSVSISRYFKAALAVSDDIISKITWLGSKKFKQTNLSKTRFVKACREAIEMNPSIVNKPNHDNFVLTMVRALKSMKEQLRRSKILEKQTDCHGRPKVRRRQTISDAVYEGMQEFSDEEDRQFIDQNIEFIESSQYKRPRIQIKDEILCESNMEDAEDGDYLD